MYINHTNSHSRSFKEIIVIFLKNVYNNGGHIAATTCDVNNYGNMHHFGKTIILNEKTN